MALIQPSVVVTSASGAIGKGVFVQSPYGIVLRQRVTPFNPNTAAQQRIRSLIAQAGTQWRSNLTDEQRLAWQTYASNTPWTGKFGQSALLGGWNYYMSQFVLRRLGEMPAVSDGPVTAGRPAPIGTPNLANDATSITVTFDPMDQWMPVPGELVLLSLSLPQPATRRTIAKPFQYTDKALGSLTTPPTSVTLTPLWGPPVAGQVVYLKAVRVDPEGRVSRPVTFRYTMS